MFIGISVYFQTHTALPPSPPLIYPPIHTLLLKLNICSFWQYRGGVGQRLIALFGVSLSLFLSLSPGLPPAVWVHRIPGGGARVSGSWHGSFGGSQLAVCDSHWRLLHDYLLKMRVGGSGVPWIRSAWGFSACGLPTNRADVGKMGGKEAAYGVE